jgi:hypothetical protein
MIGNFLALPQDELDALFEEPESISSALDEKYAEAIVDIDKAWHGIHFVLVGEQYGGAPPLSNVVFGAKTIGEEDVGYGPAHGTTAAAVKEIAAALSEISEVKFREKFDASALKKADIYPQIWDEGDEALNYLASYFTELKTFYESAARNGNAVITFLN